VFEKSIFASCAAIASRSWIICKPVVAYAQLLAVTEPAVLTKLVDDSDFFIFLFLSSVSLVRIVESTQNTSF
jgi:hypothetical protein